MRVCLGTGSRVPVAYTNLSRQWKGSGVDRRRVLDCLMCHVGSKQNRSFSFFRRSTQSLTGHLSNLRTVKERRRGFQHGYFFLVVWTGFVRSGRNVVGGEGPGVKEQGRTTVSDEWSSLQKLRVLVSFLCTLFKVWLVLFSSVTTRFGEYVC